MVHNQLNVYLICVGIIGLLLIIVNLILMENNKLDENIGTSLDYLEKSNGFECGFDTFKQSKNPVPISFILIALLFLPFDLEISSLLPYIISTYSLGKYGLITWFIFLSILMLGFIYELNSNALDLNLISLKKRDNKKENKKE